MCVYKGCGSDYRRVVGVAIGGLWEWLQEGCGSGYRRVVGVATGGLWEWLQESCGSGSGAVISMVLLHDITGLLLRDKGVQSVLHPDAQWKPT